MCSPSYPDSAAAQTYGLRGVSEAREYLRDPLLRSRFLAIASAVAEQAGHRHVSLQRLMGSPIDDRPQAVADALRSPCEAVARKMAATTTR